MPTEHGRTIHCDSSFHGHVSGGRVEAGDEALAEMSGTSCSRYPRDKSGALHSGDGGRDRDGVVEGRY